MSNIARSRDFCQEIHVVDMDLIFYGSGQFLYLREHKNVNIYPNNRIDPPFEKKSPIYYIKTAIKNVICTILHLYVFSDTRSFSKMQTYF